MLKATTILFLFMLILLNSCSSKDNKKTGSSILNKTIQSYGGQQFFNAAIEFSVDDFDYTLERKDHVTNFRLTRTLDTIAYTSTYNNGYIQYYINNIKQDESTYSRKFIDQKLDAFSYLFSIPHVLTSNDVIVNRVEDIIIRKIKYFVLDVSFTEIEGVPHDKFYLYINPENHNIEYVAQKYELTGGFHLFKRYFNHRIVNGLKFSDYHTFALKADTVPLNEMYKLYEKPNLRELGTTQLENIKVKLN